MPRLHVTDRRGGITGAAGQYSARVYGFAMQIEGVVFIIITLVLSGSRTYHCRVYQPVVCQTCQAHKLSELAEPLRYQAFLRQTQGAYIVNAGFKAYKVTPVSGIRMNSYVSKEPCLTRDGGPGVMDTGRNPVD